MRQAIAVWILIAASPAARGAEREVRGRVVDEAGRPVAGASVAHYWRANGPVVAPGGRRYDLKKEEDLRAFWGSVGRMDPSSYDPVATDSDGRFSMKVADIHPALMAMDGPRQRGGLATLPPGSAPAEVEIRLGPLVRARGSIEGPGPGQKPTWTHVYTLLPDDPTRPLDSMRLVGCGSFEGRFEMALPRGHYKLHAYTDPFDAHVTPDPELDLTGVATEVDLGVLRLSATKPNVRVLTERSKAAGSYSDYTKHYGDPAPPWHATDARGVARDCKPSDFRGKWLLVDFWGFSCRPCLKSGLPKLVAFDEAHRDKRDRFQILSICIDSDGDLKSMADVDRRLEPIVKHVWGGKALPFPVLLDPTFRTWERYGLSGLGTVVLIDPDGNLVPGDETTLAEKLRLPSRQ